MTRGPPPSGRAPRLISRRPLPQAAFWRSKLPDPSTVEKLSDLYPVIVHESYRPDEVFRDRAREPYGYLTGKGLEQMKEAGRAAAARYDGGWDVKRAWSTNYLRTVTSCQAFLDGFLAPADGRDYTGAPIPVSVPHRNACTLNAYDSRPERMAQINAQATARDAFLTTDVRAVPLAARLVAALPGLADVPPHTATPTRIDWICAADHFVCRDAHGLPLTGAGAAGGTAREAALRELAGPTLAHLAARFGGWYGYAPLLAETGAPPLRHVAEGIGAAGAGAARRTFEVHSCHDVTILALLYAVSAEIVEEGRTPYWPGYASTLAVELVRGTDGDQRVRFRLNGKIIRLRPAGQIVTWLGVQEFAEVVERVGAKGT